MGPMAILGLPFSIYLPPYIAEGGTLEVALVGLLFSLSTLWDGIVDPLIGNMVDRVRLGVGAHRRWILIASGPLAVLLGLLAFIGDELPFFVLLPLLLAFYSSFSLYDVAHLSWGAALAGNADQSARIFGAREWSAKFYLVAAFALPAAAQGLIPDLDLQGRIIAYVSTTLIALPLALFMIGRIPPRTIKEDRGFGWRRELSLTITSAPLMGLLAIQLLNAFSFGALTALFVFYADGVLEMDSLSSVLLFVTFIGGAIATPLWTKIARRLGKPRGMILMSIWLTTLLFGSLAMPPAGVVNSMLFSLLLGSGFVGLIFIHGMVADLAPWDRDRCGRDRTAFIYALVNLLQKAGVALAIAVSYAFLDFAGFDPARAGDSADVISMLFSVLPALSWALMALLLVWLARQRPLASLPISH